MIDSPFTKGKQPTTGVKGEGVYENPTLPVAHNNGSKLPLKFFEDVMSKGGAHTADTPMKTVIAPFPGQKPASGSGAPWSSGQTDSPFTKGKQ